MFVAALAFAPAAHAAPPAVSVQASPASGPAPLQVTLTATGDAAAYHWDLGDGTTADGPAVQHVSAPRADAPPVLPVYASGAYPARVTAPASRGETAQAAVAVTSIGLSLAAPR